MKILFYGFRHGHINALYKRVLACPELEIVGCVENDPAARAAAEKNLGIVFSDKSFSEWLSEDFDIVAIGCAYGERGAAAIAALSAGKHVITDKPVCTHTSELEEIERISRASGLLVACMLDLRYLPQSVKAREILKSGMLGEVRNVSFNGQHYLDYPNRPHWYYERGMHGGTVNDLGIHGIDLVRELTGLEFSAVDAARVWNAYATEQKDFCDSALFMARLENGAGVMADISYSAPSQAFTMPSYWEFRFWCERGMLTFNYVDSSVTLYLDGESEPRVLKGTPSGDYVDELLCDIKTKNTSTRDSVIASTKTALTIQKCAEETNV